MMPSVSRGSFTYFQSVHLLFSCLAALARTVIIVLNGSGETGHLCLAPDLRRKVFCFSPLRMLLSVDFFVDVCEEKERWL